MASTFKVACVQNCADDRLEHNIEQAAQLVREAAQAGAELICTPENFTCIEARDDLYLKRGYEASNHPALPIFSGLAQELGVYLSLGSLTIRISPGQVNNRSFIIDPGGAVIADYNKIHLFDVALKHQESYRESSHVAPGDQARIVDLPWGRLGLSICYDVRFPQLYRKLAQAGADFIEIPAAFTATTGAAHWHVLVRARAIENGCYVFAAAQCGTRPWGRKTYGHSLIVDPWGTVLADAGTDAGFIKADSDPGKCAGARGLIAALLHDRTIGRPD